MIKIKFKDGQLKIKVEGERKQIIAETLVILLQLPQTVEESAPGSIDIIDHMIDKGEIDRLWEKLKEAEHVRG